MLNNLTYGLDCINKKDVKIHNKNVKLPLRQGNFKIVLLNLKLFTQTTFHRQDVPQHKSVKRKKRKFILNSSTIYLILLLRSKLRYELLKKKK